VRAYLGVDGGGTKTAACVVAADGRLLARLEGPGCYYLDDPGRGTGLVAEVLGELVPAVCALAGTTPAAVAHAFLGLPGHGEVSADVAVLDALPAAVLGHGRYAVDNDTVCGWAGSLAGADGINVVAGTGSITYGRRGTLGVRVGGWSEVFGDEGSGYWLGVRALRAFSRMSDGRDPAGPLLEVFREHLDLATDLDLVDVVVNRWRGSRPRVAQLSRPLVTAARRGDRAASGLLAEAGSELAELVDATRRRLGHAPADLVPVSFSGGVFAVAEVREAFTARLAGGRYDLRAPRFDPAVGAALHAARLAGQPLGEEALQRLAGAVPGAGDRAELF
jgi:N-acetylglucosamine kinase-like BadF-type ATPase